MRKHAFLAGAAAVTGLALLAGCSGGANAPSSNAYTKEPPEGSTAVKADPKAQLVVSSGTDVRTVQARLLQLGFAPRATTGSDMEAQAGIEEFQRAYGIPVGPRDRATLDAMGLAVVPLSHTGPVASTGGLAGLSADAEVAPDRVRVGAIIDNGRGPAARPAGAAAPGARALSPRALSGADVRDVQRKLLDRGLYRGEVDGIWGPLSERALIEFQSANGLPAHAQIDAETAGRLGLDLQRLSSGAGGNATGGTRPPYPPRR